MLSVDKLEAVKEIVVRLASALAHSRGSVRKLMEVQRLPIEEFLSNQPHVGKVIHLPQNYSRSALTKIQANGARSPRYNVLFGETNDDDSAELVGY